MELSELMRRIRLGDREALKALIAQYGGGVYQRALAKTGDKALAKEITQKTFAQLVTSLQQSEDADGWQLWLDTLAVKNIDTGARIQSDVGFASAEIDRALSDGASPRAAARPYAPDGAVRQPYAPRDDEKRSGYARPAARPQPPADGRPVRQAPAYDEPPRQRAAMPRVSRGEEFEPEKRRGAGFGFGVFLLVVLCLALLWAAAGMCMNMGFLPKFDLGYAWFNANVFPLFG